MYSLFTCQIFDRTGQRGRYTTLASVPQRGENRWNSRRNPPPNPGRAGRGRARDQKVTEVKDEGGVVKTEGRVTRTIDQAKKIEGEGVRA